MKEWKKRGKPTVSPSHCLYTSRSYWKQCLAPLWFHPDQQRPKRNPCHDVPYSTMTGSLYNRKHIESLEGKRHFRKCMTLKLKSKTSATHRLLPGFSCILWGRNFWKVLKIPAFEITAGARTSISSCPLRTTTPERYTVLSWYYYLVEISFLDIGSHLLLFLR